MDPMSSGRPTGALELIISNISDTAFGAVDTLHKLMSSFGVMKNIDIDWTTMFLFFWIFFGLLVYSVANILIIVQKKRQQISEESNSISDKSSDYSVCDNFEKKSNNSDVFTDITKIRPTKQNFANGPDKCCVDWVNKIIKWFYSQNNVTIDSIVNIWINALNEKINQNKRLSTDSGVSIEFVEICREQTFPPELYNIYVDKESNENITTTCKISTQAIKFLIKAIKDKGSVNEESFNYELIIDRFEGMLKTVCINEEQLLVVRFMERPDFKATIRAVKNPQTQQTRSDNRISEDAIITAIVNKISATVVDLCLSPYKDFPRLERSETQNIKDLDKSSNSEGVERKLFVKVVKANGLAQNTGSHDPYCVIEVDEPSQRIQTSTIKDTTDPVWNEHFIFKLKEESTEILFELYDKTNDKFLGLGIVSVNELKNNPSQNQVLTLQPRPLESDQITGSLAVEFLFMEHHSQKNADSLNTEPQSVEKNIVKSNGITLKNLNKDIPLIVSTDADEELIRNDTSRRQLEVIEEQNELYATLKHSSSQSNMSSLTNQTQDIGFGQNPFIENITNPFLESQNNQKNPFLNENQNKGLNRSVSCDNISLVIPIIPPLIDCSSIRVQKSFPNISDQNLLNKDFKGNPFNILKVYRKNFYSLPTHKLNPNLNKLFEVNLNPFLNIISLPPTNMFPKDNYYSNELSFLRTNSQNNVNTNPFVKCNRITSSFSVDSMIGIDSCEESSNENSSDDHSSDNTITKFNTNFNRNLVLIPETNNEINNKNNTKNHLNKNKSGSKKFSKLFNNKMSFKQNKKTDNCVNVNEKNYINRCNVGNGNGMDLMHDSFIKTCSVNQNEIEFGLSETPNSSDVSPNKSSLTIHSTQRISENGGSEGYGTGRAAPDNPSTNDGNQVLSINSTKDDKMGRSRPKESRSLMKSLKKHFSFSKNRSKSVEIRTNKEYETPSRDSSVSSTSSRAKSMPGSREPSSPKDLSHSNSLSPIRGTKSKTESYSNISEISGYSTRTFTHEKSTLIIETKENGLKHYIIPNSLANKSKWRRKGLKLHSFNEHLFVAKHLSGSITCQVCAKLFSRRPGKQGYQCRDCNYMCHKRCHIQVEVRCTKSTISSLNIEYVVDPKAAQFEKNCSIEVNDKPLPES